MKTTRYLLPVVLLAIAAGCRSSLLAPRQVRRDPAARLGVGNQHTITESPTIERAAPSVPPPPPAP